MSLIPLNIALDYPINWEFERILRDLIQNFYDSIGADRFHEEFFYSWKEEKDGTFSIEMKTHAHPFSYEWLTHIGGSTKTQSGGEYIGQYGEGFKMCMLCLLKEGHYQIMMRSQNWKITPCVYSEKIDEKSVNMLGYEYEETEDDGWTVLTVSGIDRYEERILNEALYHFFYPQNPLFGNPLIRTEQLEVYERSNIPIPCRNYSLDFKGILYCNYLARGRLPFDLIILCRKDMRREDSRQREVFETYDVISIIYSMVTKLDPESSYILLTRLEKFWNQIPKEKLDLNTWYYVVCQLVRNVSKSETCVEKFQKKYPDLAYIERTSGDRERNRLIELTKIWAIYHNEKQLVNPIFRLLGAESLVETFAEIRIQEFRSLHEKEVQLVEILFSAAETICPYVLYDQRPEVKLDCSKGKEHQVLLFLERISGKGKGRRKRRYELKVLVLSPEDLRHGAFRKTLLKFMDSLFHSYGSDGNLIVNALLTELGGWFVEQRDVLDRYEELWEKMAAQP